MQIALQEIKKKYKKYKKIHNPNPYTKIIIGLKQRLKKASLASVAKR